MSRLVIVSNRVSLPRGRAAKAGGLAVALRDALRRNGGLWFGWNGDIVDGDATADLPVSESTSGKVLYVTLPLRRQDYEQYYLDYSNRILWPLFHYQIALLEYRRESWQGYLRVNRLLAQTLAQRLRPDDVIWIHDYHLIPMASELRALGVRNRIGFFLHIPFPAREVLAALPSALALARNLCDYDLVGFQTADDLAAFHDLIRHEAGGHVSRKGGIRAFGRRCRAGAFPISIDTPHFAKAAAAGVDGMEVHRLIDSLVGRSMVIGVDRLDYSKGLPNRFDAYQEFLATNPDWLAKVVFLQIAPPSRGDVRTYRELRRTLEARAGRINGEFARVDWTPIRYLNTEFSQVALAGFYRISRVGWVTPLRDGMNLVAKEYVAAQNPEDPGVLVLSRFAGAARELDGAVLINPYDVEQGAEALKRALAMPLDERRARWESMMEHLRTHTIHDWCRSFLTALEAP